MNEIAKCGNVTISKQKKKWYIEEKGKLNKLYELNQNDAYLIFRDYMSQMIYLGKAKLNLELKGK